MKPIFARNQFSLAVGLLLLSLTACSQVATNSPNANSASGPAASSQNGAPATSLKFVKASASETQISAGGSGEAIVHVAVQNGYHVNANPPTYAYLKATELIVPTGDIIRVSFITYPTATIKKFAFAENPLAVYEGDVPIKVVLKVMASAKKGANSIPAKLNVQACDDQVCYPPGTLELSIPVVIK
jgi:Disulphide bond corrector protein DsbC